jgi:hypothetical protein
MSAKLEDIARYWKDCYTFKMNNLVKLKMKSISTLEEIDDKEIYNQCIKDAIKLQNCICDCQDVIKYYNYHIHDHKYYHGDDNDKRQCFYNCLKKD